MNLASKIAVALVLALAVGNVSKIARDLGYTGTSPQTRTVRIQLP